MQDNPDSWRPYPPAYGYGQPPHGQPAPLYGPPQPPCMQSMPPYGKPQSVSVRVPQRRRLYDRPVIATILTALQYFAYSIAAGVLVLMPIGLTILSSPSGAADFPTWVTGIGLVLQLLVGIAMAVVYEFRNRFSFDGMLGWAWSGMAMASPALVLAACNLYEVIAKGLPASTPVPVAIAMAFSPGFAEEVVFRAIPCSNWMRVRGDGKSVIPCVLVTSLAFGLMHATNLFGGASLSTTLFQLAYATTLGILLSAVFLRTGSIWPCVIVHTTIDATAFVYSNLSDAGIVSEELAIDGVFLAAAALSVALAAIGFVLVRPSIRGRIEALWATKWHKGIPRRD